MKQWKAEAETATGTPMYIAAFLSDQNMESSSGLAEKHKAKHSATGRQVDRQTQWTNLQSYRGMKP